MKKITIGFSVLICLSAIVLRAQSFTNINAGLTGLHWSDVAWGDYDADGDLDVLIAGFDSGNNAVTKLYKNEGNDSFVEVAGLPIPGTYIGDFAWGDFDGDGDLDILVQGYTSGSEITNLYENVGGDSFVDSGIVFPNLTDGSVSFADYNNDGYTDLFIAGFDGSNYISRIYKSNGDGAFTETDPGIPGTIKSAYEWGDYDNDGYLDLVLTGMDFNGDLITKLYKNNGDETFTDTENSFIGAWLGDVAWGDYDADGDLDILLSGFAFSGRIVKVYKNNGDGSFDEVTTAGLTGVSHSSTIWGDYDNDGDLDIFIGGTYEGTPTWPRVTDVFINNGDDTFTEAGLEFTADAYWGESAWGDYDADGDLDLICCGHDDAGGSNTYIYRNDIGTSNTAPVSPQDLLSVVNDNVLTLSWAPSTDNETPSEGLTYNAYIRAESGEYIWAPMAIPENGKRLVPAIGNSSQNLTWTIGNLDDGTYYWSVQALDNHFEGSEFAPEQMFVIATIGIEDRTFNSVSIFPNPNDGYFGLDINLENTDEMQIRIFNNYGEVVYSLLPEIGNSNFSTTIDLSSCSKGLYYIQIYSGDTHYLNKVVVE